MEINSETHSQHISRQFNQELEDLKTHMLTMGGLVEKQVQDSVRALLDNDSELATRVRDTDAQVNDLQMQIDDECTRILAHRQPAASDLRLVLAVIRASSDLERIGDEASKIARNVITLCDSDSAVRGLVEVRHISEHVRKMLRDSLTAFARFDLEMAVSVVQEDELVDGEYGSAMRSLITFMAEDARSISPVLNVMWILRALERVGDHANNLAEHVVYLVKGLDIRHTDPGSLNQKVLDKS